MSAEQKLRAFLFYLSTLVFLVGLPFILSFALGYKFNRRLLRFYRTGMIVLKTQPTGASIYLDNQLLNDKTPAQISELAPRKYSIMLELEGHYPYMDQVEVKTGKATKLDKIILFTTKQDVKQLNKNIITSFWVDDTRNTIYYINQQENSLFKSDLDGEHFQKVAFFPAILPPAQKWKFSPDKEKLLYFNNHQIGIVNLAQNKNQTFQESVFVLDYPARSIYDIFWYSDSYHLIVICDSKVETIEAKPGSQPIVLLNLSKRRASYFYDLRTDTLYFMDSAKTSDGKIFDNLYKAELNTRQYLFKDIIKLRQNEQPEEK